MVGAVYPTIDVPGIETKPHEGYETSGHIHLLVKGLIGPRNQCPIHQEGEKTVLVCARIYVSCARQECRQDTREHR